MALRATLAIQNAPGTTTLIRNTNAHAIVTLQNTGTQAVTVSAISLWASGGAGSPVYAQQECRRCPLVVPAGATVRVPLDYVLPMSQVALGLSFICGATVYSNDPSFGVLYLLTDLLMTESLSPVVSPLSQTITPVAPGP
jgi:hypothetical protein